MSPLPPGNAELFKPTLRLAAQLSLLDRQIDSPDDRRWIEFWQIAERFEACEKAARLATNWQHCMFGYKARCPETNPVNCLACAGMLAKVFPESGTPGERIPEGSRATTTAPSRPYPADGYDND